jgi:octaprenyl-diphosphate synthase
VGCGGILNVAKVTEVDIMDRDSGFNAAVLSFPFEQGMGVSPTTNGLQATPACDLVSHLQSFVKKSVGDELEGVEQLIKQAVHSRYAEVEVLSSRAAAMGGKRLRPVLLLLAAKACCDQPFSKAQARDLTAAAASVELVHAASLVHDDVLDKADQRRHQPTIVHQAGNSAAVLLGDFLFTRAYATAAACKSTYPARQIAAAATHLCEGELRQQASAGNWGLSLKDYKSILEQKTASLCRVSCRLGAWLGGGAIAQQHALAQYGRLLGLAFQIHDDWLDYWGSDETVGKTLGTDLAQLKPTLPLLRLLQTCDVGLRGQLIEELRQAGRHVASQQVASSTAAMTSIRRLLDRSDAAAYTLATARRCAERAKSELAGLPDSLAKQCLLAVADYSVNRQL